MKTKKQKVLTMLLAACMLTATMSGCGNTSDDVGKSSEATGSSENREAATGTANEEKEQELVTLRIFFADKQGTDDDAVAEYVSNLPQVKALGVKVEFVKTAGGTTEYNEKLPLWLASDEQMDIVYDASTNLANRISQGAYLDLSGYLAEDSDFYGAIHKSLWKGMMYNGGIYAVPTYKEIAEQLAFVVQEEVLEKYDIDPATVTNYKDLEVILEALKQEGNCIPYCVRANGIPDYEVKMALYEEYDFLNGYLYASIKHDEGKTVVNTFDTEEFAEYVRTMYSWNQKGYISPDALTMSDDDFCANGMVRGMFSYGYSPLSEIRYKVDYGKVAQYGWQTDGVVMIVTGKPKVNSNSTRGSAYAIPAKCENPDLAYEFLRLWNTDSEVKDAIFHGIPDVHYTLVDGKVEPVTNKKDLYYSQNWRTGNNLITTLLVTEPDDKWEQYEAWNNTSIEACDLGLIVDTSAIADKLATINSVLDEYLTPLSLGFVEPESGIKQLNEQMKAAGIDDVIAELQAQYDAFQASK